MERKRAINILFVAGFGPILRDQSAGEKFYMESLGLPLKKEGNGYLHTEQLDGVKHFAAWPLSQAAESCFGTTTWPSDVPLPQSWCEFEAEDVQAATEELRRQGHKLLVSARTEPWGQVVTRLLSPEGILAGVVFTPWMRKKENQ